MSRNHFDITPFIPVISLLGFIGGTIIGNNINHNRANKDEFKLIINDYRDYSVMESNDNYYELKNYYAAGNHKIGFSYAIPADSFEEPEIVIPEGYTMVSKQMNEMKIDGKKYYQVKISCVNTVDVIAVGVYDPLNNLIRFLEPGQPVDSIKLTLK